jgi:hypothetical protein
MAANSKLTSNNINITKGLILPVYDVDPGDGNAGEIAYVNGQLKYYVGGKWTFITEGKDGSTADRAAESASAILAINPSASDGVYWINLPTVGPTQVYCIMNNSYNGGGWMMAMKATRGTTFNFNANYWTTTNTLNPTQTNINDGDAKFETFNRFEAKDILAVWPDLTANSGCFNVSRGHIWLENSFWQGGTKITLTNLFNTANEYFIRDANNFCGINQFSRQTDVRFYGFNYSNDQNLARTRWGFGWNENGGGLWPNGNQGSDDVSGGIGMTGTQQGQVNYSAGDFIGCCQSVTGINRSARVEIYVR